MKRRSFVATTLAIITLVACGRSLITDPSFDLWCGNSLCAPWEASGKVTRVKSWHRSDFAAQLADAAVLSQLSTEKGVSCIEFEVVADVVASAAVYLEMDFEDDGTSEFKQLIPESHWAKLTFNAQALPGYRKVRFILRKTGTGRAVLAQIKATSGSGCSQPLPATDRELGQACTEAAQCANGVCATRADPLAPPNDTKTCGECGEDNPCPDAMRCGAVRAKYGVYATCVPLEQDPGALCDSDEQCQSGVCVTAIVAQEKRCASCAADDDCANGQICGVVQTNLGPTRGCRKQHEAELGQLCLLDAECASGMCDNHQCAECNGTHACADQSDCTPFSNPRGLLLTAGVALCAGPSDGRASGEACYEDEDCMSQACDLPELQCFLCFESHCELDTASACLLARQPPGSCR